MHSIPIPLQNGLYHSFLKETIPIALEAGDIIKQAFYLSSSSPIPSFKDANQIDLVTATDQEVEKLIKSKFLKHFPSYLFLGEESVANGEKCPLTSEPTIICDPIDGTTNFVSGFPFVCVSIALVVNKVAQVGVIYNPILNEMYLSHRGLGAYLNGQPLPLHQRGPLLKDMIVQGGTNSLQASNVLFISEAGHDRSPSVMQHKISTWHKLLDAMGANVRGFRATGSGALDLCMIARGAADLYWENGPHAWDMAAGTLLIEEAGGTVVGDEYLCPRRRSNWSPETPFDLMGRKVFAYRTNESEFKNLLVPLMADWEIERD